MIKIIILLRAMQFFAHNAHNLAKGKTFFQDHEFLGGLYPTYEKAYDAVVERAMGLDMQVDLKSVTKIAADISSSASDAMPFTSILEMEQTLCNGVEEVLQEQLHTEGTKQLLGTLCDESEARQYQLKQRIKQ